MLAATVTTDVPFSWNLLDDLQQLFRFEFMRNAYIAGTAAAIAAGLVGYFVVLRSLSFATHTLTQVGFAGAAGGLAAGVNPLYGLLVLNSLGAAAIGFFGRRAYGRDVVTGVVQSAALGLGLLFLALYRAQEAVPVLVGDVLGISGTEVRITAIAAAAIALAVLIAYRPLLFSSLDEEIAEARGVNLGLMSVLLLGILAVTTSVVTPIVGVLLTFSLLVGPAAAAVSLTSRPSRAIALSVTLSVLYIWIALAVSYWIDFPPSVFVTAMAFVVYVLSRALPALRRRPATLRALHAA